MTENYVEAVVEVMTSHRDEKAAVPMMKYMKNQFPFLGIAAPELKRITKQLILELGIPKGDELPAVIMGLWSLPEREYHYFGVSILSQKATCLRAVDMKMLEYILTTKSWWDTVDYIAKYPVGQYFMTFPDKMPVYMDKWLSSDNMWLQRTAVLCQLGWKQQTREDVLYEAVLRCSGSGEFFIRKAIGWALREYSKTAPESVSTFVANHPELSLLSRREAMKVIERKARVY